MTPNTNPAKRLLFISLGLLVSVIPVSVAILSYFPVWIAREDASVLSGFSLILIALAMVPFYKQVGRFLKSPSAPLMWFLIFISFFLLSRIAREMTVISFVGFVTNLLGSVFFRIARKYGAKEGEHEGRT
jgi:hypothetical protein